MNLFTHNVSESGTLSPRGENLRVTSIDSQGRVRVTFQWSVSFIDLVERLLERIPPGGTVHRQTESYIKYTIGSMTKEIEVI